MFFSILQAQNNSTSNSTQIPLDNYHATPDEFNNTVLYQNIYDTYSNSIESKNFDALLSGVKGNLSYVLCLATNDGRDVIAKLKASNQTSDEVDLAVNDIQQAIDAAQLRYDYFADRWSTLIANYRKVPSKLFSLVLPVVKKNLPDTATKMSGMVFNEAAHISAAIWEGEQLLVQNN